MKSEFSHQESSPANSSKLLQNIDHAKNWLDKAKQEFNQENSTRGELILSLAEAEVKRAWELSRGNCVFNQQEPQKAVPRKNPFLLPLAAGLGIFLVCGAVFLINMQHHDTVQRAPRLASVAKSSPQPVAVPEKPVVIPPLAAEKAVSLHLTLTNPASRPEKDTVAEKGMTAVSAKKKVTENETPVITKIVITEPPETVKNQMTEKVVPVDARGSGAVKSKPVALAPPVEKSPATVKENPVKKEIPSVAATDKPRPSDPVRVETPATTSQGRIQPALQLREDDLTNIAAHSLQSGR